MSISLSKPEWLAYSSPPAWAVISLLYLWQTAPAPLLWPNKEPLIGCCCFTGLQRSKKTCSAWLLWSHTQLCHYNNEPTVGSASSDRNTVHAQTNGSLVTKKHLITTCSFIYRYVAKILAPLAVYYQLFKDPSHPTLTKTWTKCLHALSSILYHNRVTYFVMMLYKIVKIK